MTKTCSVTAPGKIILAGEHAVVYGQPAIALPVFQVGAEATVQPYSGDQMGAIRIVAPDINLDSQLSLLAENHPLAMAVRGTLQALEMQQPPGCLIKVHSTIPIAAGLGSGAAVSVAIIRALSKFFGRPLSDEIVSQLAYQTEKQYHGTPSGIDNTVITYGNAVYFKRKKPILRLSVPVPFTLVIGDSGVSSPTAITVRDVRQSWEREPSRYDQIFKDVGKLVDKVRQHIESGRPEKMGRLLNDNHTLLQEMGVSSVELDQLVDAARGAGALGAKLSGGGRGGNMIALVRPEQVKTVITAMRQAGARKIISTTVSSTITGEQKDA